MATVSSPAALPQYIEKLLNDRKTHVEAVTQIDNTLSRVSTALNGSASTASKPAFAKAAAVIKTAKAPVKTAASKAPKAPAKSGLTANEFVLAFVKEKKNPTSQEINKHWKGAGRLGFADNSLSLLTKGRHLKRVPLGAGQRGSRYSLA